jgi:hypothetical protein
MKKKNFFSNFPKHYIQQINESKLFAGLGLIILNYFSKYLVLNFSKTQEAFIKNTITRELIIFLIVFTGTRDLLLSLFLTATFIILSGTLFNENCPFCIIPEKYKYVYDEMNHSKEDGRITEDEIKNAKTFLYKEKNTDFSNGSDVSDSSKFSKFSNVSSS